VRLEIRRETEATLVFLLLKSPPCCLMMRFAEAFLRACGRSCVLLSWEGTPGSEGQNQRACQRQGRGRAFKGARAHTWLYALPRLE
jgi:hypothetical protein